MTIGELKDILENLNNMSDWETLNVYINHEGVSLKDIELIPDNGYADLFLEVNNSEEINRK